MMKIVTIIGARPQFIKAATVSHAISKHNEICKKEACIEEIIVHTGQHYDDYMSKIFFEELLIPEPVYNLGIGSDSHGKQTGNMLAGIEDILLKEKPNLVLTYGDTNSTLAGALAAVKLHIPAAHVEAGLRSYNRRMPEEINRAVTDEISHILFCPTETAVRNLQNEGIDTNNTSEEQLDFNHRLVFNVGDVMYDSILFNTQLAREKSNILSKLGLKNKSYCLATVHRPDNTDNPKHLGNILEGLKEIASQGVKIILPLHPRTRKCIKENGFAENYGLSESSTEKAKTDLIFTEPVSYLDMIQLENHACTIITDSGGVQKEAFLLNVPCITLRGETEWVETLQTGWNILTGPDTKKIVNAFSKLNGWEDEKESPFREQISTNSNGVDGFNLDYPYGNGKAAEKIVEIILKTLKD